jgi:hypothetical protein
MRGISMSDRHDRRAVPRQPLQRLQAVGRQRDPVAFAHQQALRHAAAP